MQNSLIVFHWLYLFEKICKGHVTGLFPFRLWKGDVCEDGVQGRMNSGQAGAMLRESLRSARNRERMKQALSQVRKCNPIPDWMNKKQNSFKK